MWVRHAEALRTQTAETEQTESKIMRPVSPCKYCRCIHPPRCPAYSQMCGECGSENHFSAVCRGPRHTACRLEEQENGQSSRVNTDHFICNSICERSSIDTKLKMNSFYCNINIINKLEIGKNNNSLPLHIFKILFPKAANKGARWSKTCKLK